MEDLKNIKDVKREVKNIQRKIQYNKKILHGSEKKAYKLNSYKEFEEIYIKYGSELYSKYVPKRYRNKDIKALLKNGRFIELYNKHGKKEFEKYEYKIRRIDIRNETGSEVKAYLDSVENVLKKKAIPAILTVGIVAPGYIATLSDYQRKCEEDKYGTEIQAYIDEVNEYGAKIKSYNLNDLQNIMKVMNDMWENIVGYGNPNINLTSCMGLDMATEDATGVCRNMADDMARKLNANDEKYNARTIIIYEDGSGYELANIKREIVKEENEERGILTESQTKLITDTITKFLGNHVAVLIDLPEKNVKLVIDPTNPGIGMFQNGKIKMFNSKGEDPITFTVKPFGESIMGLKKLASLPEEYISSIGLNDYEELEREFGVDAQNTALKQIRTLGNDWIDTIKVDLVDQNDKKEQKKEQKLIINKNEDIEK